MFFINYILIKKKIKKSKQNTNQNLFKKIVKALGEINIIYKFL